MIFSLAHSIWLCLAGFDDAVFVRMSACALNGFQFFFSVFVFCFCQGIKARFNFSIFFGNMSR